MSKNVKKRSILILALCIVLAAATVLCMAGCKKKEATGTKSFKFEIVHKSGETKTITVKTDKETVGAALVEKGLIAGDESAYGLYVKTVDGETLDYETDGMYWAFYIDGEYAMTGVDSTTIEEGKTYTFKAEKG